MNSIKSHISILIFLIILCIGSFSVYFLHTYVANFSERGVQINTRLQGLEESKEKVELYKKILSKGSVEQKQIDSYILKEKDVFKVVTDLEKQGKSIGMFDSDKTGIMSVTKREDGRLKELGADQVVLDIDISDSIQNVDLYIQALSNLPYVSYIEKISLNFSEDKTKAQAHISLIIIELL